MLIDDLLLAINRFSVHAQRDRVKIRTGKLSDAVERELDRAGRRRVQKDCGPTEWSDPTRRLSGKGAHFAPPDPVESAKQIDLAGSVLPMCVEPDGRGEHAIIIRKQRSPEFRRVRWQLGAGGQGLEQFRAAVTACRDVRRRIDAKAPGRTVEPGEIGIIERLRTRGGGHDVRPCPQTGQRY